MPQMSLMASSQVMPLTFPNRVGLVVTPSRTPQALTVRISSMSAVSRKSFMAGSGVRWARCSPPILGRVPHPDVIVRLAGVELGFLVGRRAPEAGRFVGPPRGGVLGSHAEPHPGEAAAP